MINISNHPKVLNCPKSIFCQLLVIEAWLIPQNDCKTWLIMNVQRFACRSDNWNCPKNIYFLFFGAFIRKLHEFPDLVNSWSNKVGWPLQNDLKNGFTLCILRYVYPSDNWKCPKSDSLVFPNLWQNFKSFHITGTIYHIKFADFSKHLKKHLSISV